MPSARARCITTAGKPSISTTTSPTLPPSPTAQRPSGPNASCWMTAGSGGATTTRHRLATGLSTAKKWPNGLTPLIDHVHTLGMTFGLWFEPEMVNPDSDLFRAHPDWLLGPADQVTGRNQMVLDMGRAEVRELSVRSGLGHPDRIPDRLHQVGSQPPAAGRRCRSGAGRLCADRPAARGASEGRDRKLRHRRRADRLRHSGAHPPGLAVRQQRCAGTVADAA